MEGDAICLFQGASRPTIIRFNKDYGTVILITVTPPQTIQARSEDIQWSGCLQNNNRLCPRNLRCIWDWSKLPGETLKQGDDKDVRSCLELIKENWNSALVFGDLKDYEQGERKFHKAMKHYEMASQEQDLIKFQTSQLSFTSSVDLDLMNKYYAQPPLLWAAERGYTSVVQLFIARFNVDISFKDTVGRTAIQLAAEKGHLAVVERLLQENADVNAREDGGRTALQAAAGGGHLAVVERLLQENADVNAAAGEYRGRTALQAAAEGGHLAIVELLESFKSLQRSFEHQPSTLEPDV
jgi:ankyrin repeat protein